MINFIIQAVYGIWKVELWGVMYKCRWRNTQGQKVLYSHHSGNLVIAILSETQDLQNYFLNSASKQLGSKIAIKWW